MAAIALLALLLGVVQAWRKVQFCRERINQLREDENLYLEMAAMEENLGDFSPITTSISCGLT
ncbi:hypothetical protein [Aquisphaera giovannonii]|uniref:hypothetical protein n=1 Tax=Aquisphaera giovannonii TaxID=406548 RepID=UPI001AEFAD24|nr:hypothetical protein [Aquisphaera giovannonii]